MQGVVLYCSFVLGLSATTSNGITKTNQVMVSFYEYTQITICFVVFVADACLSCQRAGFFCQAGFSRYVFGFMHVSVGRGDI